VNSMTVGEQIARRQALIAIGAALPERGAILPCPSPDDWATRPLNRADARLSIAGWPRLLRKNMLIGRIHRGRRRSARQLAALEMHTPNMAGERGRPYKVADLDAALDVEG